MSSKDRLEIIVGRLFKLFDVKPSLEKETVLFRNHKAANHNEVCKAFEHWLNQTKLVFGEVANMLQNQSLKDSGVDLLIDLPLSKLRFGIQVKSFFDVQDTNFARNVKAQITESHRHNLNKLIIAFAGDLTYGSQLEKVRGLISELHQTENNSNYLFMIPPEKVLAIYNAFKNEDHPLKYVLLENKDAIIFAKGVEDSLSNETRRAKVTINIEYLHPNNNENYPYKIQMKYQLDTLNLDTIDRIEHLPLTENYIKLTQDQIKEFKVYDKEGKLLTDGITTELFVWADNNPIAVLDIATISKNEYLLSTLDGLVFRIVKRDNLLSLSTKDQDYPLSLEFIFALDKSSLEIKTGIDYDKGDAITILKCIKFLQSFNNAKKLKCFNRNTGKTDFFDMPYSLGFKVDQRLLEFVTSLATLQGHTGTAFKLPKSMTNEQFITESYISKTAAKIIETKRYIYPYQPVSFKIIRNWAIKMVDDYIQQKINSDLIIKIPFSCMVLGQSITINEATLNLSQFRPSGNLIELLEAIKEEQKNYVEIEMIPSF